MKPSTNPILFLLLSSVILLNSCEPASQEPAPVVPPVTQYASIDTDGGSISMTDSLGYSIELIIPKEALDQEVSITMTSKGEKIKNPIDDNIFRGLTIQPENLLLKKPATLRLTFPASVKNVDKICVFTVMGDDFVIPIAEHTSGSHSVEGKIYFFKQYAAGIPSEQEIVEQIEKVKSSTLSGTARLSAAQSPCSGGCPPIGFGWQGTETTLHGLLEWAAMLSAIGNDSEAAKAISAAEILAEKAIKDFLNTDIPENPCGNYTKAAWQYFQLSKLVEISQETADAIEERALGVADICAIQFTIEIDREIKTEGNEKEHQKAYGVVKGSISPDDFSDGNAAALGHGSLGYTYHYEWLYNQAMNYKSTADATGTVEVTCDGSTKVRYPEGSAPEIWLIANLHFKDNITGTSCDTGDDENPCQDVESHAEWNERVDFLFENGYVVGGQTETEHGYVRNKMTLFITRMDQQGDDDNVCY